MVTGGEQYDYSKTNFFKDNILRQYNQNALTNYTYNIYLDQYGYAIGVDEYEGQDNYLFMTGYDRSMSHLGIRTATAAAIFLDGTMTTIQVDVNETNSNIGSTYNYFQLNTGMERYNRWFTYTTSEKNGETVYTLTPAENWLNVNAVDGETINSASVRLTASAGEGNTTIPGSTVQRAYGNDDSVYITVDVGGTDYNTGITKVNGTYTGVQDVDLEIANKGLTNSIFAVYDEDRYIIGAVVIGKDVNSSKNYAYGIDDAMNEFIGSDDDGNYYWEFKAVVDGKIETLTVKTEYRSVITRIQNAIAVGEGAMFQLTYDVDGYVTNALTCVDVDTDGVGTDTMTAENVYSNSEYTSRDINAGSNSDKVYSVNIGTTFNGVSYAANANQQLFTTGRTLYIGSLNDYGVTLVSGAPVIVIQTERYSDGSTSVVTEEYSTIAGAMSILGDAVPGTQNVKEFNGQIAAVLNENGTAQYLVLNSATVVNVDTDDGSTPVQTDVARVTFDAAGNINLYDSRNTHLTGAVARTYELWQYHAGQNGYVKVDEGSYTWGQTPSVSLAAGSSYYVVIDGVQSNIVRK